MSILKDFDDLASMQDNSIEMFLIKMAEMDAHPIVLDAYDKIKDFDEYSNLYNFKFLPNKTYIISGFKRVEEAHGWPTFDMVIYMGMLDHEVRKLTAKDVWYYADLIKTKLIEQGMDMDLADSQKEVLVAKIMHLYDTDSYYGTNNSGSFHWATDMRPKNTVFKVDYSDQILSVWRE